MKRVLALLTALLLPVMSVRADGMADWIGSIGRTWRTEADYLAAGRAEDAFYESAAGEGRYASFVYGISERGRDLTCLRVGPEDADVRFLLVFGVHGFEDERDHDGVMLKILAELIARYYLAWPDQLNGAALYIVPTANPDGLISGRSKNAFGRCNARGLDVNRDFPIGWTQRTSSRERTGDAAWSTAEACAIRDLTERIAPTYAADVHGYISRTYGDEGLCKHFDQAFGFRHYEYASGGMLSQWLATVTDGAMLLELDPRLADGLENGAMLDTLQRMVRGIGGVLHP